MIFKALLMHILGLAHPSPRQVRKKEPPIKRIF